MWNASRLILMNASAIDPEFCLGETKTMKDLDLPSRWIISRLFSTLKKVSLAIEQYRYSEAESLIYEFFWGNFCDWYLEIIKDRWDDVTTQNIAFKVLEQSLKMIHPFMPFVTEEVFGQCREGRGSISRQPWPKDHKQLIDKVAEERMQTLIDLVTALRNLRAQWNIKPQEKIRCHLSSRTKEDVALLTGAESIVKNLARVGDLTIDKKPVDQKDAAAFIVGGIKGAVPLGDLIDIKQEKKRMLDQITEQKKVSKNLSSRLKNKDFLRKAPKDVVDKEKTRLETITNRIKELETIVAGLKS
jgi:valyl-tRNA synthetase